MRVLREWLTGRELTALAILSLGLAVGFILPVQPLGLRTGSAEGTTVEADSEQVEPMTPVSLTESTQVARTPGGMVRVNNANTDELAKLPGIGGMLALEIVKERERNGPFRSLSDLDRVKGIGSTRIARLQGRIIIP